MTRVVRSQGRQTLPSLEPGDLPKWTFHHWETEDAAFV